MINAMSNAMIDVMFTGASSTMGSAMALLAPEVAELANTVAETIGALGDTAAAPLSASEQTLADLAHVAGMVIVAFWGLLLLLSDAFAGPGRRGFQRRLALLGVAFAFVAVAMQYGQVDYDAGVRVFSRFMVVDHFSLLIDMAILATAAAVMAFCGDYARTHRFEYGEQEALIFLAAFGMMMLAHAGNLLALFLGIETMSIAVYVLVGARWNKRESSEAAFKYFLMGAFSSGILLMGLALLYGGSGTTDLRELQSHISVAFTQWGTAQPQVEKLGELQQTLQAGDQIDLAFQAKLVAEAVPGVAPVMLLLPGILLTLGALLFKVSAVPFHMWTPDAYDGAPTPVTAFMAAAVKIAGFAAILKLFVGTFYARRLVEAPYGWTSIVAVIALATMTVGNLSALRQNNVKRLLAYSSVAHVGYLLIGVVAAASYYGSEQGVGAVTPADQLTWARESGDAAVAGILYYLIGYAVATVGAFACVAWLGSDKKEAVAAHQWSGLASRHPAMALGMTICLLSLMGMPPTAGFIGKLFVFKAGMANSNLMLRILVVLALINSVIGAYYYLRLIVNMYFRAPLANNIKPMGSRGAQAVVAIGAFASLALGLGANQVMRRCELGAAGFHQPAEDAARAAWVDRLRARWEAEDAALDGDAGPGDAAAVPAVAEAAQPRDVAPSAAAGAP